ncbi:hypothetical protein N7523_002374 [Penicillium sp. IBT 18751x]|nr:hypothetical protein N7523_002374 [Penicillium sp. IBT 18751x]
MGAIPPYSLLRNVTPQEALQLAAEQCHVQITEIEDIYPCTAAQESLFALSEKSPNSYVARYVYALPDTLKIGQFEAAIVSTLGAHTILRTRLIHAGIHGTLQAVMRKPVEVAREDDLHAYLASDCQQLMPPGEPLIRIAIVHSKQKAEYLVITIHHALYDDWSLNVVLHDIESAYKGNALQRRAFADFTELSLHAQSEESAQKWRSKFQGLSSSDFPRIPSSAYNPAAKGSLINNISFPEGMSETQQSAVINLAWSILLSQYTGSSDSVFGVTFTGRRARLSDIENMSGPTIATVPFRVQLSPETKVADALQHLLDTTEEMLPYEQRGLRNISRLGSEAATACQFKNLIVIQSPPQYEYEYFSEITQDLNLSNHATFGTYAVTLVCDLRKNGVRVQAVYDDKIVPSVQMQRILYQLKIVIGQLTEKADSSLVEIDSTSPEDLNELRNWNHQIPTRSDECMHELILEQCRAQPDSSAVVAWDGQFTYRELEKLSGDLSAFLSEKGIGPENFVPINFEKSRWTTVAMLAVMRAGAAFVLLDPSNPMSRNQEICRRANAACILTSKTLESSSSAMVEQCIPVYKGASSLGTQGKRLQSGAYKVSASNLLYAVFTSGSTGTPKGVQIEHGSFVTSTKAYISTSKMTNDCRALQFASYAFDVSISDTLVTLAAGGCLCVPSEEERKSELAKVVATYDINWVDLTPSLLRQLQPEDFPSLRTVTLGGEPMLQSEIDTWGPHVRLLNVYGPAECCVLSTVQNSITNTIDPRDIGFGTGCVTWIVDPTNYNRLMPIGAIGELVIEGHTVGRGYLADKEKTAAAFIESIPEWMQSVRPGAPFTKLYRTGDLAQYTPQGSLRYVGRKDMQVKLRGQRLELEEVEYHVSNVFQGVQEVVADVISPERDGNSQLVAFITQKNQGEQLEELFIEPTQDFHRSVAAAIATLRQSVPAFMIPSFFLPITHVLRTVSDKTDRRRLREAVAALSHEQLRSYRQWGEARTKRAPDTEAGRQLQAIWSQVLGISSDQIGLDDGFFELGGDSITAMKVASMAKSQGLPLSVPDLFQSSSLDALLKATHSQNSERAAWDWEVETTLRSDLSNVVTSSSWNSSSDKPLKLALTGSTGFLGQEILRLLITDPRVDQVHCLGVRSQGKGVGRQSGALQSDKVFVHSGDLSLPNLGLSEETLLHIMSGCCGIIHCGADISFVKNFELLSAVNVRSTQDLSRLAIQYRVPIHYISSAALSHFAGLASFEETSVRRFPPAEDGEAGYLTSKWVSEVYLEKCNESYGLPVTIHRISSIVGPGAPEMDITNNVLKFSRKMRSLPDLSTCKGYVDLITLETAASNIVDDVLRPIQPTSITYIHESGEVRVAANKLKEHLERESGETFTEQPLANWIESARNCGMPELVAKFLAAMPPSEIDIATPFIQTSRVYGRAGGK